MMTDNSYQKARAQFPADADLCPICRGRICADGLPGPCASHAANVRALDESRLNLRVLHDVAEPELGLSLLGMDLAMPVLIAPMGGVCRDASIALSEDSLADALIGGAADAGIAGSSADSGDDAVHESGLSALGKASGRGIAFFRSWEDPELNRRMDRAEALGARAVGLDLDAADATPGGRPLTPRTPARLARLIRRTSLPFVVKGVMTPDEGRMAVEAGAAAVVVSNHGNAAPGQAPGVAEVLPWIAEAVKGRAAILACGGARSGADVLKLLALGADAVMIGRPFAIAALGGGRQGVRELASRIGQELARAMVATATARTASVSRSVLYVHR